MVLSISQRMDRCLSFWKIQQVTGKCQTFSYHIQIICTSRSFFELLSLIWLAKKHGMKNWQPLGWSLCHFNAVHAVLNGLSCKLISFYVNRELNWEALEWHLIGYKEFQLRAELIPVFARKWVCSWLSQLVRTCEIFLLQFLLCFMCSLHRDVVYGWSR